MSSFRAHVLGLIALLLPSPAGAYSAPTVDVHVSAPVKLTLDQAVAKALVISPSLASASADIEGVRYKLAEAKAARVLPELRLRVLSGLVPDVPPGSGPEAGFPTIDVGFWELGPFLQARVEGVQPLFTFGRLNNVRIAAEQGVAAKEAGMEAARNETVENVKRVWYGLVFLEGLRFLLDEMQERAGKARDRVQQFLQEGSADVTDIDLMRIDAFIAESERQGTELFNGLSLGEATLGILTGGIGAEPVGVSEQRLSFTPARIRDLEYYLGRARVSRPELRQLESAVRIKEALMKVSRADYFPSFFLAGFYGMAWAPDRQSVDNPFLRDDFNYHSGGAAIGLEQKLAFHLTSARHRQARADYLKTAADRDQAWFGVQIEIRKAHAEALTKERSVEGAQKALRVGRAWVTATTLNFGVGLTPPKDLLEAFVVYSKFRVQLLETLRDYYFSLGRLSRSSGEEVTEMTY